MEAHIKEHPFSTDTAEKHMVMHLCTAEPDDTVADYLRKIRMCQSPIESFVDVYVTDSDNRLVGAIDLPLLLKSDPGKKLSELMRREIITVHPTTDRERAARLAIHNELDMLPVVDKENRLLGALSTHSILRILHEESIEDLLRAAGYRHAHKGAFIDVLKARASGLIRARIPWLLLGLVGGMLATTVVSLFSAYLKENVVLAFFMPVIVYMAAAIGTQTQALYLRVYDTGGFQLHAHLLRELGVAAGISVICSALIFLYTVLVFGAVRIGLVVSLSMLATIIIAVLVASIIPTILVRLKKDPAVGSGPFATVVQDILSLVVYFLVATALL